MSISVANKSDDELINCLENIFSKTDKNFNIELWNGKVISYSYNPKFVLKFLDKDIFKDLVINPNIMSFAKAFMNKTFDIEGNIFDALKLKDDISHLEISNKDKLNLFLKTVSFHNTHSKEKDKESIAHHYDISNEFYKIFLGETMMYSCAYFKDNTNNLNSAQENKMEHICRKLRLKKGDKFLDVGCGWGSMIIWAAKHYDVQATGITISKEQYEYTKSKIKIEGLENKCFVELKDYRDIKDEKVFDKIVSIGMFEHVGSENLSLYFNIMNKLLKDDGLFLNHGITNRKNAELSKNEAEFIDKYIFPNGELKNISDVLDVMETSKFDVFDVECLREHYYKTLKCWVENLKAAKDKAISIATENIYRTWLLYMSGCAINFEEDFISVYQVLLGKQRQKSGFLIPLTREYMYK